MGTELEDTSAALILSGRSRQGDAASVKADMAEAKAIKPDIVEELRRFGFQP